MQVIIGFKDSLRLVFPFTVCKTLQDMYNQEFIWQNIFKQKHSKIVITFSYQARIKGDKSCKKMINQDRNNIFDSKDQDLSTVASVGMFLHLV